MRASPASLTALILSAAAAPGQPAGVPVTGGGAGPAPRVYHLKVLGDLDCERVARDFAARVDEARLDGASFILLEMDGNRARADVVLSMARSLAGASIPSGAYLADPADRRVGLGQLALALWCGGVIVAPGTTITQTPADQLRALAPEDTDWASAEEQLAAGAGERLEGGGSSAAAVLLTAREAAWFRSGPGGGTLESAASPGATPVVVFGVSGLERVEVTAPMALALGLARAPAPSAARALSELGVKPGGRRTRAEVRSGLAGAARAVGEAIERVRAEVEAVEESLRLTHTKLDRRPLGLDYRQAGERAVALIADAERAIEGAEALLAEYPELLREPVASSTDRRDRVLAALRRALASHRATAEEYLTRR